MAAGIFLALGLAFAGEARADLVVRHDNGGEMRARVDQIAGLRKSGTRVQLRGRCNSACTLYLGLEEVCLSRSARLGFHGPSFYGEDLALPEFERWSRLMAAHYREPLRSWYLQKARYLTRDYLTLSGEELIRLGYSEC